MGSRYLDRYQHAITHRFIRELNRQGFPKLVIVEADPRDAVKPNKLLLYSVHSFTELGSRIGIGQQLYACMFRRGLSRSNLIQAWATSDRNRIHHGTREDYDGLCFCVDPLDAELSKRVFSPPLITHQNQPPAWPVHPGRDKRFYKTHVKPVRLPPWSQKFSRRRLYHWLDFNVECDIESSMFESDRTPSEILA